MIAVSVSPGAGRIYGKQRVCRVLGRPRSTFYFHETREQEGVVHGLYKRGPKPPVSDEKLLALIKKDLASSPFTGEGHRKVYGRLKTQKGLKVGMNRVLRIMREANLLSPYRRPQKPNEHNGRIITQTPDEMWGTDGSRVLTVQDGWGWVFAAVDHFNSECVGHHVCKIGDRFNALEPVKQGLDEHFGNCDQGCARGLKLRMDNGSQYLSDHFQKQIKFWGIAPSFAFVEQPQTNGVVERFFRTLKEQVIHGRIYETLEDVRVVVSKFIKLYNEQWLIERLGLISPKKAREKFLTLKAA